MEILSNRTAGLVRSSNYSEYPVGLAWLGLDPSSSYTWNKSGQIRSAPVGVKPTLKHHLR